MIRHTKSTQSVKNKIGQQSKKNSMVNLREVLTYKDSRKK